MSENSAQGSRINFDMSKLDKLRQSLSQTSLGAKVGILTSGKAADAHDGITNVELGIIHEFGSATNNIPPRSFLRMPIETKRAEILKWMKSDQVQKLIQDGEIHKVYELLGVLGESIVQRAFASRGFGKWLGLKESTIKRKGSSAPLIDTGQLRRSITSEVVKL